MQLVIVARHFVVGSVGVVIGGIVVCVVVCVDFVAGVGVVAHDGVVAGVADFVGVVAGVGGIGMVGGVIVDVVGIVINVKVDELLLRLC